MPTPPKTQPNPETSLEDRLSNIEVLLRQAELVAEEARQREYALRTRRLISEAKTNLVDIGARQGDNIEACELDALRTAKLCRVIRYINLLMEQFPQPVPVRL